MKKLIFIICVILMLIPASVDAQENNQPFPDGPIAVGGPSIDQWNALVNCESTHRVNVVDPSGLYHGLFQFDVPTWHSIGGVGIPSQATAAEQWFRAFLLYKNRNRQPWPNCGRYLNGAPITGVIPPGNSNVSSYAVEVVSAPTLLVTGNDDLAWTKAGDINIRVAGWCDVRSSTGEYLPAANEIPIAHIYIDGVLERAVIINIDRPDVNTTEPTGWYTVINSTPGAHYVETFCVSSVGTENLGSWFVSVPDVNKHIIGIRNS